MKLIASGVTNSAASVRSPSFSRSSSSTTTTIRPALISATVSVTSANITPPSTFTSFDASHHTSVAKRNAALIGGVSNPIWNLQRRLDLKTPGLQQRLRNILRILVPPGPFTKPGRTNVLVRCQLELLHHLLERCDRRNNRPNRFRLAPVGISTTFCHLYQYLFELISALRYANTGKNTAV